MNRFKKELKGKGIIVDYPYLPYYVKGDFGKPGNICIEEVIINAERQTITTLYNVTVTCQKMLRNGDLVDADAIPPERKWKSVEVTREIADRLRRFLNVKGIRHETSGCYNLIHFQIFVNETETAKIKRFLARF